MNDLPLYECVKKVRALKIARLYKHEGSIWFKPQESGYPDIELSNKYLEFNAPQVGGYYIVYDGGHESYSPSHAFETGYNLIEEPAKQLGDDHIDFLIGVGHDLHDIGGYQPKKTTQQGKPPKDE